MSNEAINWALTSTIKHSSAKFVLVVMANCADSGTWEAWPSVAHLAESTGQDRKTVMENIKRLIALGFISDTGARKGSTKQVPIYRLNSAENGTVKAKGTESGTVPNFPINSTEIPYKESRFSAETVPKTGHGTQRNPQGTQREPKSESAEFIEAWAAYPKRPGANRAAALKAWTARLKAGESPETMLAGVRKYAAYVKAEGTAPQYVKQAATFFGPDCHYASDWTHVPQSRAGPPQYQTANEKAKSWADRITGKTRNEPERQHSIIDLNDVPA